MEANRENRTVGRGRGLVPTGRGRGLGTLASTIPTGAAPEATDGERARHVGRGLGLQPANVTLPTAAGSVGRGRGLLLSKIQASASSASASSASASSVSATSSSTVRNTPTETPVAVRRSPFSKPTVGISLKELSSVLEAPTFSRLCRRPARGMKGKEIPLESNLFQISFTDMTWYKYDVEISTIHETSVELKTAGASNKDRIESRRMNRKIMFTLFRKHAETLEGQFPAYDGRKTLICTKKLFLDHMFTVNMEKSDYGPSKQFIVKLKFVMTIDVAQIRMYYENRNIPLNPEIIQATNIVIDSTLADSLLAVNRAYFDTSRGVRELSLSGGKVLLSGLYTSTIYADWQPLLIVDKARTAFYKNESLIDYIADFLQDSRRYLTSGIPAHMIKALANDLKGLMMRLNHTKTGRSVKVSGISMEPANAIMFQRSDSSQLSVADYFAEVYAPLKYPNLPCITVLKANKTKTDYYPIEVCVVKESQPYRKKLNPKQTQTMIKYCQEKPNERIADAVRNCKVIKSISGQTLSEHGIKISDKPVRTIGRQIESPQIRVKDQTIRVRDGCWRQDEFHEGASLSQWIVVDCAQCGQNATSFARRIRDQARRMKFVSVGEPVDILDCANWPTERILDKLMSCYRQRTLPFMAVIILDFNTNYSEIKHLTETTDKYQGIITQCVKKDNVITKCTAAFVGNLLKKINAKLGGINNSIARPPKRLSQAPYIIIGADVSHSSVHDLRTPSIAAVVGSLDTIPSKYCTEIRVQRSENNNRIEYIKDLKAMTVSLLKQFYAYTRLKPAHIYYLRDGVSEGQFDDVRHREITALREACVSLQADYRPSMTVIIAQKRHHTRFNVVDRSQATASGNVPAGTYIDRDVVHPEHFDLYMYTHHGRLGTSRPTHYHLIHADEPITTDEFTELIYHLCHCYARTSSSVSIPAPIYYAHLAAYRAREHLKGNSYITGSELSSIASDDTSLVDLSLYQKTCTVSLKYRNLLYYA